MSIAIVFAELLFVWLLLLIHIFLASSALGAVATAAAGRETSIVVIFLVDPTDQPFGFFVKKANIFPPLVPFSMAALVLNWIIEEMVAGGLLRRLVYWSVESIIQSQLQLNSVIMMIFLLCVAGFSLHCVFYRGKTNDTCLTAIELGGSSLSLGMGARAICNAISMP